MKKIEIYVGTYAKYNNGSIAGEWVTLQDYDNIDDLYKKSFGQLGSLFLDGSGAASPPSNNFRMSY